LLISIFIFAWDSPSHAVEKKSGNEISKISLSEDLYLQYCRGGWPSISKTLEAVPPTDPDYIAMKMWYYSHDPGISALLEKYEAIKNLDQIPEVDRLFYAQALLHSFSLDVSRLKQLMDFHSKDKDIESHRLLLKADIGRMSGESKENLEEQKEVFDKFSQEKYAVLVKIFYSAMHDRKTAKETLRPYYKYITTLHDGNPYKLILLAFKETVESDWKDLKGPFLLVKEAHDICSPDPGIAALYISTLEYQGLANTEKDIIEEQVLHKYHSPTWDLRLAQIFYTKGDYSLARKYATLADKKRIYLFDDNRKALDKLLKVNKRHSFWIYGSIAVILVILGSFFFFMKSRNT
jgi:hypothetical protein